MHQHDGQRPDPTPAPRVGDLSALLGEIDALRTTLQTDLSLAAAALDEGADELAGQFVRTDLDELAAFEVRALSHLRALEGRDSDAEATTAAVLTLEPRRRWKLPAAPLVAAAAALVGFAIGIVPERALSTAPVSSISGAAVAGYELSRLAQQGASAAELSRAAKELNAELTELVAEADNDPVAAQEAWLLLRAGTEILSVQPDQRPLRSVLLRAGQLERELRRVMLVLPGSIASLADPDGVPAVVAASPRRDDIRAPARRSPSPAAGTTQNAPTPTPADSPVAPSTAAPTAAPTSAPAASPSPAAEPTARRPPRR